MTKETKGTKGTQIEAVFEIIAPNKKPVKLPYEFKLNALNLVELHDMLCISETVLEAIRDRYSQMEDQHPIEFRALRLIHEGLSSEEIVVALNQSNSFESSQEKEGVTKGDVENLIETANRLAKGTSYLLNADYFDHDMIEKMQGKLAKLTLSQEVGKFIRWLSKPKGNKFELTQQNLSVTEGLLLPFSFLSKTLLLERRVLFPNLVFDQLDIYFADLIVEIDDGYAIDLTKWTSILTSILESVTPNQRKILSKYSRQIIQETKQILSALILKDKFMESGPPSRLTAHVDRAFKKSDVVNAKYIREEITSLTQPQFASTYQINLRTLKAWEASKKAKNHSEPVKPAKTLLRLIAADHVWVAETLSKAGNEEVTFKEVFEASGIDEDDFAYIFQIGYSNVGTWLKKSAKQSSPSATLIKLLAADLDKVQSLLWTLEKPATNYSHTP